MTRTILSLTVTLLLFATPLSAAVIPVQAAGTLEDGDSSGSTTADGIGDGVATFNNLIVGPREDSNPNDSTYSQEFRTGLRFDISLSSSVIDNAGTIFLEVTTAASDNNFESGSPTFDIALYGLDSAGSGLVNGDFEAAATLLATIARGSIAPDTQFSLDVTDFVQTANDASASIVEFRLQAAAFTGTPDAGSGLFVTRFDSDVADDGDTSDAPQLRVIPIPGPSGLGLFSLCGAAMLFGRKRRRQRRPETAVARSSTDGGGHA